MVIAGFTRRPPLQIKRAPRLVFMDFHIFTTNTFKTAMFAYTLVRPGKTAWLGYCMFF